MSMRYGDLLCDFFSMRFKYSVLFVLFSPADSILPNFLFVPKCSRLSHIALPFCKGQDAVHTTKPIQFFVGKNRSSNLNGFLNTVLFFLSPQSQVYCSRPEPPLRFLQVF